MLTRAEVIALKKRHAKLVRQRKRAESYFQLHGKGGVSETRHKNEARIQEANAELPVIEEALRTAWD